MSNQEPHGDENLEEDLRDQERERQNQNAVNDIISNFENEFHQGINESRAFRENTNNEIIQKQKKNDFKLLQEAWIKEKMVPDILPYEEGLIERIIERIRKQLEFIEMNSVELQTEEKDIKLMLVIVESELERVQFLIRSYVRLRLQKIDKYALYIQGNNNEREKLNLDEVTYMQGHLSMLYELFDEQFLKKIHAKTSNIGEDELMIDEPDLDRHVLFRCERESRALVEGEIFTLKKGEVYVMRYKTVAELLSRHDIVAI